VIVHLVNYFPGLGRLYSIRFVQFFSSFSLNFISISIISASFIFRFPSLLIQKKPDTNISEICLQSFYQSQYKKTFLDSSYWLHYTKKLLSKLVGTPWSRW
jgi:hypothetical protein